MDSSRQVNSINNPALLQQSAVRLPDLMPESSRDNVSIFNRALQLLLFRRQGRGSIGYRTSSSGALAN
jgi:hypothetical protein